MRPWRVVGVGQTSKYQKWNIYFVESIIKFLFFFWKLIYHFYIAFTVTQMTIYNVDKPGISLSQQYTMQSACIYLSVIHIFGHAVVRLWSFLHLPQALEVCNLIKSMVEKSYVNILKFLWAVLKSCSLKYYATFWTTWYKWSIVEWCTFFINKFISKFSSGWVPEPLEVKLYIIFYQSWCSQ